MRDHALLSSYCVCIGLSFVSVNAVFGINWIELKYPLDEKSVSIYIYANLSLERGLYMAIFAWKKMSSKIMRNGTYPIYYPTPPHSHPKKVSNIYLFYIWKLFRKKEVSPNNLEFYNITKKNNGLRKLINCGLKNILKKLL